MLVFPFFLKTSCFHTMKRMGQNRRRRVFFVEFVRWRHGGRCTTVRLQTCWQPFARHIVLLCGRIKPAPRRRLTHFVQSSKMGTMTKGFDTRLANRPSSVFDLSQAYSGSQLALNPERQSRVERQSARKSKTNNSRRSQPGVGSLN